MDRLNKYCEANGLSVCRMIVEAAISARIPLVSRPGGAELVRLLENRQATDVVVMSLDRLFRSTEDARLQSSDWDATGVRLHVLDVGGQSLDTSSAMGRLFFSMLTAFAEFEQKMISERTAAVLADKKRKGQAYGQTPFGFHKQGKDFVPDDAEQKVLCEIFTWRREGLSLYAIASRLNDLRVPSKKNGKWHPETVRHILQNDLYCQSRSDSLIPLAVPKKPNEPAETTLMGQLVGVVNQLGDDKGSVS